jgi:hypothetical protein
MMDTKQKAELVWQECGGQIEAIAACNVVIQVLYDLSSTKMCQFHKEIDFWNEVILEIKKL